MVKNQQNLLTKGKAKTEGSKTAISTSKIRKITVTKKNRSEKGRRRPEFGSNPHSKGEDFSRPNFAFLPKRMDKKKTKLQIKTKVTINTPK